MGDRVQLALLVVNASLLIVNYLYSRQNRENARVNVVNAEHNLAMIEALDAVAEEPHGKAPKT